ncbi:unnamed protein product [Protopolystoma xenopodis]|uniref:UDP-glucose--hexose-1-phosphate uridylyltransferase n=1 Tax=Protopolystoma xenopodis TaxID=117903 RepID=A0A3S5A9L9_9PLAT|nr:unnamed protein product [Protopolystoma xenopodis]
MDQMDEELNNTGSSPDSDPLFAWSPAKGECKVMCFHPRSELHLASMSTDDIKQIIDCWCLLTQEYASDGRFKWIQIFENRGELMGSSNPHPHCQVCIDIDISKKIKQLLLIFTPISLSTLYISFLQKN